MKRMKRMQRMKRILHDGRPWQQLTPPGRFARIGASSPDVPALVDNPTQGG
jgi:hypothetical protein